MNLSANWSTSGYAHPDYIASLAEHGRPHYLQNSRGSILVREIPGSNLQDGMGAYPLFSCEDWRMLGADLAAMRTELVSLVLVTEPFGNFDQALLEEHFSRVVHFKNHFVADLDQPIEEIVKHTHRQQARRTLQKVEVRVCSQPWEYVDIWLPLFQNLVKRHDIRGMRTFSKNAFSTQFRIPGMVMFEALHRGQTVGLDLWYVQQDVAYGHLAAFSDLGYELAASYATKWTLLNYFRGKVRWVDFGGGAGLSYDADDGLSSFKRGWSTGVRPAYICGQIFQPEAYQRLCEEKGFPQSTDYFPAYRHMEFL